MRLHHIPACLGLALALAAPAAVRGAERERNHWPFRVSQLEESGHVRSWQAAGPLLFRQPWENGQTVEGFRPFYIARRTPEGAMAEARVLYPLFSYKADDYSRRWSFLQLINRSQVHDGLGGTRPGSSLEAFDVWPFYFSRQTGSPETSYRALFPIAGTIKNRLFHDRLSWVLAPLYLQTEKSGQVMTGTPWPFVRRFSGNGHSGLALWPLLDWREKPGVYRRNYYLWPFIYDVTTRLDEPVPARAFGVLPFYAYETSPEVVSESYAWPFVGYTHRVLPHRYDETRYFWPLFVQGRGDDRFRNRWAPFYTYSKFLGEEKTWILWPVFRKRTWPDPTVVQTKTQVLFFLYWSRMQQSVANPDALPARKTHAWPLFSHWNNGAGHRQFQVFSPLEVFFPDNDNVRLAWSPLFALYRYDAQGDSAVRHSALFDLVTWRRTEDEKEFHLGPIVSLHSEPDGGRFALAGGLVGLRRTGERGWRPFWFDFSRRKPDSPVQMGTVTAP